jgi:hypothetical protein
MGFNRAHKAHNLGCFLVDYLAGSSGYLGSTGIAEDCGHSERGRRGNARHGGDANVCPGKQASWDDSLIQAPPPRAPGNTLLRHTPNKSNVPLGAVPSDPHSQVKNSHHAAWIRLRSPANGRACGPFERINWGNPRVPGRLSATERAATTSLVETA